MEAASASASVISEQSNKENIPPPPVCKAKGKKNPIPVKVKVPSFKGGIGNKRKPKRIPLADITQLFNNSELPHQQLNGVFPSISQMVPASKTLRMGFR